MKKIILSIFITFLLVNKAVSIELKNNIGLPYDIWNEIILYLFSIKRIETAKTFPEIRVELRNFYRFCLVNKKCNSIIKDRDFKINERTLKNYYIERENEIINKIKKKLQLKLTNSSFEWFNHINAQDNKGWTPLMYLVFYKYKKRIIKLLIENGAELDIKSRDGNTVLDFVNVFSKKGKMLNFLINLEKETKTKFV